MIFSHKDRPFTLALTGSLINNFSHGYYIYPAIAGEPNFLELSFQGK